MWLLQLRRKHSCWKKKHHMLKNVAKFICLECTKNLNRDLIHFKTKTICMLLLISFINNFWSIIFELPHIIWSSLSTVALSLISTLVDFPVSSVSSESFPFTRFLSLFAACYIYIFGIVSLSRSIICHENWWKLTKIGEN